MPTDTEQHPPDTGDRGAARPAWYSLPRNVWVLSLASFLRDVASEMLVYLVPLYLANVLGFRTAAIGLIEGIAESISSLLKIIAGWLSDRSGRRKPFTVLGYGLAALSVPLLFVAQSGWMVGAARWLDRVGKGIRTAPRDALIADSVHADQRGASFGLHRAADSAGAFLGLLIAIGLVWSYQAGQQWLGAATFHAVVLWATVPAVLAVVVVWAGVRELKRPPNAAPLALSITGLDRRFKRFLAVIALFTLGNSSDAFLVLRAQASGASVVGVLGMLAAFNLVYAVMAGPAGALSDRIDRRRLIVGGWLFYALVYLGFAWAGAPWHFWLLWIFYALYYAATEGVAKAMVADFVPPEQRGTAYGAYSATIGIMVLPASLVAGILWQGIGAWAGLGPAAPFLFGGLLALLSAALLRGWVP